jgi:hypothetical protein
LLKAAHVGFIFRDPICHLVAGKFSRFRHLESLPAHPGGEKQHQFLFLFRSQRFRCRLNFIQFAYAGKLSYPRQRHNNPIDFLGRFPAARSCVTGPSAFSRNSAQRDGGSLGDGGTPGEGGLISGAKYG